MPKRNAFKQPRGWIEFICGPMFSGKSEELFRKLNKLQFAGIKYIIFKHSVDFRDGDYLRCRNGQKLKAILVNHSQDVYDYFIKCKQKPHVIAIDEVQFFDEGIADVCIFLAENGVNVYVAGIENNFRGEPFPSCYKLLAAAERVLKLTAICTVCGAPATRTQRLVDGKPADYNGPMITPKGAKNITYTARCRRHHFVPNKPPFPFTKK